MPFVSKRKSRFRRKRNAGPRNFQITQRDEEILLIVARHRIARSTHIIALIQALQPGASEQQILRRLEHLYHRQYLSRPLAQLESYRAGAGSRPIAYMLGNRGADLLAQKYGWRRATVDWTAKARTAKRGQIEHAIEITDFMVALNSETRMDNIRREMLDLPAALHAYYRFNTYERAAADFFNADWRKPAKWPPTLSAVTWKPCHRTVSPFRQRTHIPARASSPR